MDKELHLKMTVRLYTDDNQRCFGPGIATLLERVRAHKSLRSAAASMGMAYSKAMKLIRRAESVLGFPLTIRTTGGASGGGSRLTPEGKEWITRYEAYRNACVEANSRLYSQFFPEQRETASAADRE